MKVKNIVFSGFAAAILMGTASANATTPFKIASQAYVDQQIENLSGANGAIKEVADDVDELETAVGALETAVGDNSSGLVKDVNDLKTTVNTATTGLTDRVGALETTVNTATTGLTARMTAAEGDIDDLQAAIGTLPANTNIADTLDGKVNTSDAATSIRTVANGASDGKWATEKAVATIVEGLTGGNGTVSQQIADALGSDFTGQGAYATVTAALADKQDVIDSNNKLDADSVDDTNSTNKFVTAADKTTWNGKQNALSQTQLDSITAAAALLAAGYNTCINQQNGSGHCVLTADEDGLSWIDVTNPFEIE